MTLEMAFYDAYQDITQAFTMERIYAPHTRWLNDIANVKCRIQKGQITPPDGSPQKLVVLYLKSYGSSELC